MPFSIPAFETTKTVYNDAFLPVEYTDEYRTITAYTYDAHYRVLTETSNGIPLGFTYNGEQYFYLTNNMGDVIAITYSDGEILAEYVYDEWGNVLDSLTGMNTALEWKIANVNPLRYRGYYYDEETVYYYLQSRYYDPSICRFINADLSEVSKVTKDIPVGTNSFAYCNNDPVNNSDPSGRFKKIKWKKNYVGTDTVATLIDIVIAIISPAVSASYDATGFVLKQTFRKYGEKSAEKYFVNNIKPVIKKAFQNLAIKYAMQSSRLLVEHLMQFMDQ